MPNSPLFSIRHYAYLASILRDAKQKVITKHNYPEGIISFEKELILALKQDNPKFDEEMFRGACK